MSAGPADPSGNGRDPLGKRALFSPPAARAEESDQQGQGRQRPRGAGGKRDGVKSLYSVDTEPRMGTVVVECSDCRAHTRISVFDAGARIASFSLWIPGKRFSRYLSCPACGRRTWSRIRWTG